MEKENRHHGFKELPNFSQQWNKTTWAVSNNSWSFWKTYYYYYYYKQQVGEGSSHCECRAGKIQLQSEPWLKDLSPSAPNRHQQTQMQYPCCMRFFQWWILWNPGILAAIELLSRIQKSQREAEGLNSYKRLHCFKQNINSKNEAGETSWGKKMIHSICKLLVPKNNPSYPQP